MSRWTDSQIGDRIHRSMRKLEKRRKKQAQTYKEIGLLAELGVVLADERVRGVVLGGLNLDATALNV